MPAWQPYRLRNSCGRRLHPHNLRDRRDRARSPHVGAGTQPRRRPAQGVLERTNITLAAVATDMMGISRRAILAALIHG